MSNSGCRSLEGAEKLVFRRSFHGVADYQVQTEVSQKLVHSLELFWMDEYHGFCRLDNNGDIQCVIRVRTLDEWTGESSNTLVSIASADLHRYMAIADVALVQKFDFTRVEHGSFAGWDEVKRSERRETDLLFHVGVQSGASFAHGINILRPNVTTDQIIEEHNRRWQDTDKKYATFKTLDWKNCRCAEVSCAPEATASYFDKDSPLPFQISPVFFRPEVLQKYKADPEKYTIEHRSISSRAGWHLETYDVNEVGQVHTYLRYLSYLPYSEQLYWQSFNEWPKGTISERAYRTDFEGNWDISHDSLLELKSRILELDKNPPDWWKSRGESLHSLAQYPLTTSPEEWSNAILALDQLLIEGFVPKSVRTRLDNLGWSYESSWGSIRLIEELMIAQGLEEANAKKVLEPLKRLHLLRTKVKGHAAVEEKRLLIKDARAQYGSLKEQFVTLVSDCESSFGHAENALALE